MKKGFTLIELLAVIVLIAIIAVITIPIIGSAIEKAKLGALKDSAYGLIDAGVIYNAQYQNSADARFDIINGNQTTTESNKLKYKGNVENGTIVVSSTGKVLVCINSGKYKAFKDFNENEVTVVKKEDNYDVCSVSLDENNNTVLDKVSGNVKNIYPVGSIYMSVDDTNPHDLFGGEWEKIEGRFLLGTSNKYSVNSTGGSEDAELIAHNHNAAHSHRVVDTAGIWYGTRDGAAPMHVVSGESWGLVSGPSSSPTYTAIAENVDLWTSTAGTSNGKGKNMPPYVAVNIWKRVS